MGFSSPKSVIFSFSAQTMPRRFLVDTTYTHIYVKQLAIKTKYFIQLILFLILVSEFVVMAILSEWWSMPTTPNDCGHIPVIKILYCGLWTATGHT